ncbi:MAG: family efflux transporter [Caulobacter sp.]|nr:family efflux transporter [Caulobacter sp.]
MTITTPDLSADPAPGPPPQHPLLIAPVAPTLAKLAAPNLIGMMATTAVSIAETAYIGHLGAEPLAAAALVLPLIMLMGMMSAGAMGGGVSSAISRALGAGLQVRAEVLARHAAVIGLALGLGFTVLLTLFGHSVFTALGGRGGTLHQAVLYSGIVFSFAAFLWLSNMLASVLRGSGNMVGPSLAMLSGAALQVAVGGVLCFGLGPFPRLGIVGVGIGQATAGVTTCALMLVLLHLPNARVRMKLIGPLSGEHFADILKVGVPAMLSPIQTVATTLVVTAIAARFGTQTLAGYGIGSRLEFLLVPIAFSVGVASLPMVGLAIGAGDIARARRVAWTAGAMGAVGLGAVGLILSLFPGAWSGVFTTDLAVRAATETYLRTAGPFFAFFGLSLALYFSSQGAGRIAGPLLAGTLRLAVVATGGLLLVRAHAPPRALFALVALGMVTMGLFTAGAVALTPWGPNPAKRTQTP